MWCVRRLPISLSLLSPLSSASSLSPSLQRGQFWNQRNQSSLLSSSSSSPSSLLSSSLSSFERREFHELVRTEQGVIGGVQGVLRKKGGGKGGKGNKGGKDKKGGKGGGGGGRGGSNEDQEEGSAPDFQKYEGLCQRTMEWLTNSLRNTSVSKASPQLVDKVVVKIAGGDAFPLINLAQISPKDARTLRVSVYDPSNVKHVSKALDEANLDLTTRPEGSSAVLATLPKVTMDYRKKLVAVVKQLQQDGKTAVRNQRKPFLSHIQNQKGKKGVPKDIIKEWQDELDQLSSTYSKKVDSAAQEKEQEIMKE